MTLRDCARGVEGGSAAAHSGRLEADPLEDTIRIRPDGAGDLEELDDVKPTLAVLKF